MKKIKDYAFIHFKERDNALRAIEELNGQEIDEQKIEVALAKPQADKKGRIRGMSGFGALNVSKGPNQRMSRGGPRGGMRGGPSGRGGMRGPPRYDDWGYDSYGGYDQGYSGWDEGYGDNYSQGYNDSYYDDYYGADQSYDMYYDSGSRGGGRGGMNGGRGGGGGGGSSQRGGSRGSGQRGGVARGSGGGSSRGGGFGGRGGQRGGRGAGGRIGPSGAVGGRGGGLNNAGMKRKMDSNQQGQAKRQYPGEQSGGWNPQPIAQKPLSQSDGGNYYGYGSGTGSQEWYQDSYGQQWK